MQVAAVVEVVEHRPAIIATRYAGVAGATRRNHTQIERELRQPI